MQHDSPLDLNNLEKLGNDVYLTSNDDITTNPDWIKGVKPDSNGKTEGITAAVIVNDKGNGNVDAFYMYFYTYNWGGLVLGWNALNFGKLHGAIPPRSFTCLMLYQVITWAIGNTRWCVS